MEAQYFLFGRRWRNLYIPNLIKVIAESEKKHILSHRKMGGRGAPAIVALTRVLSTISPSAMYVNFSTYHLLCIYVGAAGRARTRRGQQTDLIVKAPATAAEQQEDIDPEDGDDFVDPFDTTIVDKVIPVRKAIKSADLAVEDEDFNPTSTFNSTKEEIGM